MALKFLKVTFGSSGRSGSQLYVNSSNAFILIVGMTVGSSGQGAVSIVDSEGNLVDNIWGNYNVNESLSVSGSDSFSTTAPTSQGITSTTQSINESIAGLSIYYFGVTRKALVPPGFGISSTPNVVIVYGFIAIQADSLEELRGFL
jgi:hypothetical protein